MKEVFLTPIDVPKPPHHTQIQVRCFTCKHFPVCLIKKDYLKTAVLIEGILGNPQKDYIATEKEIIDTYKNDIIIPHGDTKYIKFIIKNEDGSTYTPEQGDSVRFAMKKNKTDDEPLILRQIDPETMVLKFEPNDTKDLPMDSIYVYDVELTRANGDVSTFIRGRVIVTDEVY